MGIKVEFNPDLCLRNISEFKNGNRKLEECIPETLEAGKVYDFLKKDHRVYYFDGEQPLVETFGDGTFTRPKASILILETTQFVESGVKYTKGKYKVVEIFDGSKIEFEWMYRTGFMK